MNIKEIIVSESKSRPTTEGWGDDIVDYGKNVASAVGDVATRAGKAAIDPETYKQAGRDIAAGAKFAVNNPGQAAYNTAQAVDDAVRAGTNTLTFGYADKLDAKMKSMMGSNNYDDELKNTYAASADALDRSPIASKVGEIGSYFAPLSVFNAGMKGANLISKGLSKVVPSAVATNKAGKVAGKVVKGTGAIGGGIAADKAAAAGAKKVDPNNPYVDEGKFDKGANVLARDLEGGSGGFGGKAAGTTSLSNKLRSASTPTPGSLKPPKMSGGQGPTSSIPTKKPTPTPTPTPKPKTTDTQPKTSATDAEQRLAKVEKTVGDIDKTVNPSIGRRVGNWAGRTAGNLAVGGALTYAAIKGAEKYAFSPDDSGPHTKKYNDSDSAKKWDAAYKAKQDAEKPAEKPTENPNSKPQNTDTDNGSMFSKDTFKESSTELERVKYLMGYRN